MSTDAFHTHFGPEPASGSFNAQTIAAATDGRWKTAKKSKAGLGRVVESTPEGVESAQEAFKAKVSPQGCLPMRLAYELASSPSPSSDFNYR